MSNYKFFLLSFVWFAKLTYRHLFVFKSYKNPKNGKTYIQDTKFIYRKWYIYKERNKSIPTTYKVLAKKFKRSGSAMRRDHVKVLRILRRERRTFMMLIGLKKTNHQKYYEKFNKEFDNVLEKLLNEYKDDKGVKSILKSKHFKSVCNTYYIQKGQIDIESIKYWEWSRPYIMDFGESKGKKIHESI